MSRTSATFWTTIAAFSAPGACASARRWKERTYGKSAGAASTPGWWRSWTGPGAIRRLAPSAVSACRCAPREHWRRKAWPWRRCARAIRISSSWRPNAERTRKAGLASEDRSPTVGFDPEFQAQDSGHSLLRGKHEEGKSGYLVVGRLFRLPHVGS